MLLVSLFSFLSGLLQLLFLLGCVCFKLWMCSSIVLTIFIYQHYNFEFCVILTFAFSFFFAFFVFFSFKCKSSGIKGCNSRQWTWEDNLTLCFRCVDLYWSWKIFLKPTSKQGIFKVLLHEHQQCFLSGVYSIHYILTINSWHFTISCIIVVMQLRY